MALGFFQFASRRTRPDQADRAFIREVNITPPREPRSRRVEWVLAVCWVLIGLKCWWVWWAIEKYQVPINPWWVVGPTLGAALICTWLYWRR